VPVHVWPKYILISLLSHNHQNTQLAAKKKFLYTEAFLFRGHRSTFLGGFFVVLCFFFRNFFGGKRKRGNGREGEVKAHLEFCLVLWHSWCVGIYILKLLLRYNMFIPSNHRNRSVRDCVIKLYMRIWALRSTFICFSGYTGTKRCLEISHLTLFIQSMIFIFAPPSNDNSILM
jgi:hypothetical protein